MWPEIEQVSLNRRYELVLSGDKLKKRYEEKNELDPSIWQLRQLNFLELSQCSLIETLSEDIGNLINLSTLTLTLNKINKLPTNIKKLENIRHLNLSNNQLNYLNEDIFLHLCHLETLNLSNNLLEKLPRFSSDNKKLAIINLSYNQLEDLPDFPEQLENLSQMDLSSNKFQNFPNTILKISSLKFFAIDSNQLTEIPSELSQLHRLKEIRFKFNPLKDNRLKKLMEQDKIKAVLEYLTKQWNEQQKTNSSHSKLSQDKQKKQETNQENQELVNKIEILHIDQPGELKGKQITILPEVIQVRPYILCCILRNIDLSTPGNFKKFLNIQNELHDNICQKRTLATIGTHDLSLISGNLIYDARNPNDISLIPLGKGSKLISAKDFYDQLCRDAEHERKLKKRNQLSGLHKYLTLLENESSFPYLSDQDQNIISLPPLTNSERTKLNSLSESILIEITSNNSMDICRRVMDEFLHEIIKFDLGKKVLNSNIRQTLTLQQTKVIDDKGQLKTTFPSRQDLNWNDSSIIIERNHS